MIAFNFINVNEVNPTAYVVPNSSVSVSFEAMLINISSVSVSGSVNDNFNSGSGNCLMSVFPFGVCGISSNCINTVGTMYLVNLSFKCSFKSSVSISSSAVKYAQRWSLLLISLITTAFCFIFGYFPMLDSISPISILSPLSLKLHSPHFCSMGGH